MTELKDVIETLDQAADSFDGIATKEQKKIYDEVIVLAKDLETDASGKVKQSIANLKRLTQIKAKLAALSKDKEWVAGITRFAQYFGHLQKMQNEYYSQHFTESTLGMNAQKKNELMREMAVQNTMEALMGDGLKANVTDKLNDILLRAVTSGAKFADLQDELRAHLMGENGGKGAFARYATTYATTALSQFAGQTNKLMTDDLGLEWFMYTGSNKETTREFCEHLTAKKYIHKSEIPTILTGKIDDYQCAIYEKTGLPFGMIAGTTPENFQCNCGGWNCRHQLVPVAEQAVPISIRKQFEEMHKDQNNQQAGSAATEKGTQAFYELMRMQHQYKEDVDLQIQTFQKFGVKFEYNEDMTASQIQRTYYDAINKTQLLYEKLDNKKEEINLMRSLILNNLPDKYSDVMEDVKKLTSLVFMIRKDGYQSTKERIDKLHRRMMGIINRLMEVGDSANGYSQREVKKVASLMHIKAGEPMKFMHANNGKVNPHFDDGGVPRTHNCQRCVVAFEMRMRGLDVYAGDRVVDKNGNPDNNDPFFENIDPENSQVWINNATGKSPQKIRLRFDTLEQSKRAFNYATRESGRYVLYILWAKGNAHVVNVVRNKRNQVIFYDGQVTSNMFVNFEYYYNNSDTKPKALTIYRVDDCNMDKRLIEKGVFKTYAN